MADGATDFYDKESANYTKKRYPRIVLSYIQYIFKRRLALLLSLLEDIEKDLPEEATILEIGCADGVVFKAIEERFPGRFSRLVGMDVSPLMVEEAVRANDNDRAVFCLREHTPKERFDVVVELGVHPFDVRGEASYVSDHLKPGGYFFYDSAGSKSLYRRIKLREASYANDYKPYHVYESLLQEFFVITKTAVYGFFVPKLWKYPSLGRSLQPIIDHMFEYVAPDLFHEKLYLLVKRGESGL